MLLLLMLLAIAFFSIVWPAQAEGLDRSPRRMKRLDVAANWIVVTSIHAPTSQMQALCALAGWRTVVVADRKTPVNAWAGSACVLLSLEDQAALGYRILEHLPLNNYGRKNVGYLYAIQHGAQRIYETDDDNMPSTGEIPVYVGGRARRVDGGRHAVQNPYAHFGQAHIWPRGYPLGRINATREPAYDGCPNTERVYPVQQGLVSLDPDVDAIFRMTHGPEIGRIRFDAGRAPLTLARGTYCPYNTQNTMYLAPAFWGLLVPITPTIRVCDIWRSYWVQRMLWEVGEELLFMPPTAEQVRNPHDFMRDYREEEDLYLRSDEMIAVLTGWRAPEGDLFDAVYDLTKRLNARALLGNADVLLMRAWLEDLIALDYRAPLLLRTPPVC